MRFDLPLPCLDMWQSQTQPMNDKARVRPYGSGPPALPNWMLSRIRSYQKYVDVTDDETKVRGKPCTRRMRVGWMDGWMDGRMDLRMD